MSEKTQNQVQFQMGQLETAGRVLVRLRECYLDEREVYDKCLTYLRQCILGGDTSGDEIRDFLILRYPEKEWEERRRALEVVQAALSGNGKNLLLVIWRSFKQTRFVSHSLPSKNDFELSTHFYLGVGDGGLQLFYNPPVLCLPQGKYLRFSSLLSLEGELIVGSSPGVCYNGPDLANVGRRLIIPCDEEGADSGEIEVELLVGEQAVRGWFGGNEPPEKKLDEFLLQLGYQPPEDIPF